MSLLNRERTMLKEKTRIFVPENIVNTLNLLTKNNDEKGLRKFLSHNPDLSIFRDYSGWEYGTSSIKENPMDITLNKKGLACFKLLMSHNYPFQKIFIYYLNEIISRNLHEHMQYILDEYPDFLFKDMRDDSKNTHEFLWINILINKKDYHGNFIIEKNEWSFLRSYLLADYIIENALTNAAYLEQSDFPNSSLSFNENKINQNMYNDMFNHYTGNIEEYLKKHYEKLFRLLCHVSSLKTFEFFIGKFGNLLKDLAMDNKNFINDFIQHYCYENKGITLSRIFGNSMFLKVLNYFFNKEEGQIYLLGKDKNKQSALEKLFNVEADFVFRKLVVEGVIQKSWLNNNVILNKNGDTFGHFICKQQISEDSRLEIIDFFELDIANIKNNKGKIAFDLIMNPSKEIRILKEKQCIRHLLNDKKSDALPVVKKIRI